MCRSRSAVLTLFLGLGLVWMTAGGAQAQIEPIFQAGDSWHGFSWNPGNTSSQDMRLAVWSVNGNTFLCGATIFGKGRAVSGRFSADGALDITEVNSSLPITMHGRTIIAADGSASMLIGLAQGGRSLGMARMLRLFAAVPLNRETALPPDPYFPPGPCYVGSMSTGPMEHSLPVSLTFNPTIVNPNADRPQPADYTGVLLVGDLSYSAVLCIDRNTLPNGNFRFEMIAHAVNTITPCVKPGALIPCIRVSGELQPGSIILCRPLPRRFAGTFERYNNDMALFDRGTIDVSAP